MNYLSNEMIVQCLKNRIDTLSGRHGRDNGKIIAKLKRRLRKYSAN